MLSVFFEESGVLCVCVCVNNASVYINVQCLGNVGFTMFLGSLHVFTSTYKVNLPSKAL